MNSQTTDTQGKVTEGLEHRSFCLSGAKGTVSPSWCVYIFTSLEALCTLHYWDFMEGLLQKHD